jgi:hypothetical protein
MAVNDFEYRRTDLGFELAGVFKNSLRALPVKLLNGLAVSALDSLAKASLQQFVLLLGRVSR